jgi:hypothetical protein
MGIAGAGRVCKDAEAGASATERNRANSICVSKESQYTSHAARSAEGRIPLARRLLTPAALVHPELPEQERELQRHVFDDLTQWTTAGVARLRVVEQQDGLV